MLHRNMLPMPFERAVCGAGALACFAIAIVLTPGNVRSQPAPAQQALHTAAPAASPALTPIAPARDAFAPRANVEDDAVATPRPIPIPPALQPHVVRPSGRDAIPAPILTAIAMGSVPTALVELGGTARAVVVGDALADSHVVSISANAVELADGRRLVLSQTAGTP